MSSGSGSGNPPGDDTLDPATAEQPEAQSRSILANSTVMAVGTTFSRLSGYVRSLLLVAVLGGALHGDLFALANSVPNALYVLLAGGVFNAVLVPQLVRAIKRDPDGGAAYTDRIITLAALFLGAVTILLVAAAPWVMELILDADYDKARFAEQKQSAIDLARWCLPQVFFYGMFTLVGQVLNARGTFGPMMWAPIANNVIAIGVLVTYLLVFGSASGEELYGPYTTGQEVLLGLGSTLGIVAQFLILLPYLRRAGVTFRPRFDFRGTGLGHTLRLGLWTVGFVIVNQIAYFGVARLASSGTVESTEGTGYLVYSNSFLIAMVPHAIVTVSLVTAILPRLSAYAEEGRHDRLARTLADTLRTSLAVVLPVMAVLPVVAPDVANVVFGWGAGEATVSGFVPTISLFGVGLAFFTVHYFMLRGFYALEQTRTVFWIQCAVAATNLGAAVLLVREASARNTAPALVVAYALAYVVGSAISYAVLRRTLGGLGTPVLVRFAVRVVCAIALAGAVAWVVMWSMSGLGEQPHPVVSLGRGAVVGLAYLAALLGAAHLFRITEITGLVQTLANTLRNRRRAR